MRPSRVRAVARQHLAAGPRTRTLAAEGRVSAGCSSELLDYLETAVLTLEQRDDVAALWEYVERVGVQGAVTLRELDRLARERRDAAERWAA